MAAADPGKARTTIARISRASRAIRKAERTGGRGPPVASPRMAEDRLEALRERTRYVPHDVEPRVFERWEEAGIFHPEPEGTGAENYSIAIPPPNVTGALHMGHALNG